MNDIGVDWKKLDSQIQGVVGRSQADRGAYATDASVYQQFPTAVAFPKTAQDVATIIGFAREHQQPIIGRGGGTSLSGQAIGSGIIMDFSRFMNRILDLDIHAQTVTVEPGVVLDDLNDSLSNHGLLFAPDPATASRATIGGMIGNNACGTRSIVFGRTCDAIESLHCWLPSGESLTTQWLGPEEWQHQQSQSTPLGSLYRGVSDLIERYRDEIQTRIPRLPRMAAGYSLQLLLDAQRPRSLSDLIVGSEGTLALVSQATLRLRPLPAATALVISSFESIDAALESLPFALEFSPSAIELLDDVLVGEAIRNASTRELSQVLVPGNVLPEGILMVEFFGETEADAAEQAQKYINAAQQQSSRATYRRLDSTTAQKQAWEVRRLGLGLISNIPGKSKAIALIEDACIPVAKLPEYNRFVFATGAALGMKISAYAHASVGVLHYKVMLDLHEKSERQKMREMAEACFEKCLELGGVFSGEHGDGIVRGEFLQRQFGPKIYQAFVETKRLFDPENQFNPHRKIDAPPLDHLLRFGNSEQERLNYLATTSQSTSRFRYGQQGDLVGAIEQCNGVGACRKNLKGTMCPSYRATRDEKDSTRGRANLLRLAISGQLDPPGLANPELHDALDLCLSCKACKSECPNAVDMARLKSEALQVKWDQQGISRKAKFVGAMPQRLASLAAVATAIRGLNRLPPVKWVLEKLYDIDRRRSLPAPASHSFNRWWKRNRQRGPHGGKPIALFVDAWNRFLEPEIAMAVVELLWSCGYDVTVLEPFDALRTRLSMGLLDQAAELGQKLFEQLEPIALAGTPIVCIEPSEASALKDDLPDLIRDAELGRRISGSVQLLDDFLASQLAPGDFQLTKIDPQETRSMVVHPHCHQRALFRPEATREILTAAGFTTQIADLGCCGMAGSFGYSNYDVSRQIAQQRFLPAIQATQNAGNIFVATGTSCREQSLDLAQTQITHWAAWIKGTMRHDRVDQ